MSGGRPDEAALAEDDLLLDRLGRGEAHGDDAAAALLSEWRSSLPEGEPPDELVVAVTAATRRPARWGRRAVVLATTTVLLGGGVAAAAEHARPGNPLWPVTEWLYPDVAGSRSAADAAGDAVADARAAIEADHPGAAVRLLEQAASLAERVTEPGERDGLLSDIAALRARVATPSSSPPPPVPDKDPVDTGTEPLPSGDTEPAVPSAVAPSASEAPPTPAVPTSTPGLPVETAVPLPSLPLGPPVNPGR